MRVPVKSFIAALCLGLCACSPAASTGAARDASVVATPAPAQAERVLVQGLNVTCHATTQFTCGSDGKCEQEPNGAVTIPVDWSFNGADGTGSLCIATGCAEAIVTGIPGETGTARSVTGLVLTTPPNAEVAPGAEPERLFDGLVTMAGDGTAFRLVQANPDVVAVWSGRCEPVANPAPSP